MNGEARIAAILSVPLGRGLAALIPSLGFPQEITGPLVNALLFVAAGRVGVLNGILVGCVPSIEGDGVPRVATAALAGMVRARRHGGLGDGGCGPEVVLRYISQGATFRQMRGVRLLTIRRA